MTEDQRKALINSINQQKGYFCWFIKIKSDNDTTEIFHIYDEALEVRLLCELTPQFPYEFPKIYLFKEFADKYKPIPHLSLNNYICTFDSNTSFPNFEDPEGVFVASVERALEIIRDGINKENEADFVEEFTSYWELNGTIKVHLLCQLGDRPKVLNAYKEEVGKRYIISDSIYQLQTYVRFLTSDQYDKQKLDRCLYIPFSKNVKPPYPNTNQECYRLVEEHSDFLSNYESFLNGRTKPSVIIFSQPYNDSKILAGWIHPAFSRQNGFRRNKVRSKAACLCFEKNRKIIKADVTLLSKQRLFTRGGDGLENLDHKISICGCGSIGSHLVNVLCELGLNHFTFVDNDILNHENIARHFCGAEYVGKLKVNAIQEKLTKHYVDVDCDPLSDNIINIIRDKTGFFNQFDFNFLIVGSPPIEMAMVKKFQSGQIKKPIIIMWVEPFLLGGHALILNSSCDVESTLYDNEYAFKYSVIEDGRNYKKREAGCQSTFIPYSGFEAKRFLYDFCDYFHNKVIDKDFKNVLFSWGGRLDWARSEGIDLTSEWLAKKDRTIIIKELS